MLDVNMHSNKILQLNHSAGRLSQRWLGTQRLLLCILQPLGTQMASKLWMARWCSSAGRTCAGISRALSKAGTSHAKHVFFWAAAVAATVAAWFHHIAEAYITKGKCWVFGFVASRLKRRIAWTASGFAWVFSEPNRASLGFTSIWRQQWLAVIPE